jgi:hypothetical protein
MDDKLMSDLTQSWDEVQRRADPNCGFCHGTGWEDNDGCCGRCDCIADAMREEAITKAVDPDCPLCHGTAWVRDGDGTGVSRCWECLPLTLRMLGVSFN